MTMGEKYVVWGFASKNEKDPGVLAASEKLYKFLTSENMWNDVLFCVDSNPKRQGENKYGKETFYPIKLKDFPDAIIIVNVQAQKAIIRAAAELGLENRMLFTSCHYYHNYFSGEYPAGFNDGMNFYQYMSAFKDEIMNIYDKSDFITSEKLKIYFEVADRGHDDLFTADFYGDTAAGHSYFCDELLAPEGAVTFVDIGAYIGDSIEPVRKFYGSHLKKCLAFEPNQLCRAELENYVRDHDLNGICDIYEYALGNQNCISSFEQNGTTSVLSENDSGTKVLVRKFDDIYEGHIGTLMIKMDIEGEELSALKGMKKVITENRPYLAICVYHKLGDILDIPRYIKEISNDGYNFYLRGGWHLECWAIPKK